MAHSSSILLSINALDMGHLQLRVPEEQGVWYGRRSSPPRKDEGRLCTRSAKHLPPRTKTPALVKSCKRIYFDGDDQYAENII